MYLVIIIIKVKEEESYQKYVCRHIFFNKKVNDLKILNKLQTTILHYYSIKRQVFICKDIANVGTLYVYIHEHDLSISFVTTCLWHYFILYYYKFSLYYDYMCIRICMHMYVYVCMILKKTWYE